LGNSLKRSKDFDGALPRRRRGTLLVDFAGLVVRPMMRWKRESVTVNELWWNEKCPKINECCEAWMEVSK
jgi:hypothetical protein